MTDSTEPGYASAHRYLVARASRQHRPDAGRWRFLLRKDDGWNGAEIIIWRVVETEQQVPAATTELADLLAEARFTARVQVVTGTGDPFQTIRQHSRQADLLFLGLRPRAANESPEVVGTRTLWARISRTSPP